MWPSTTLGRPALGSRRSARAVLGEVAEVLAHLGRAGGAVDADDVGLQRRRARRARRRSRVPTQHATGGLDRDLHLHGTSRPAAAIARRQPIIAALACSRSKHVSMRSRSTPPSSRPGLLLVGVAQLGEARCGRATGTWCRGRSSRRRTAAGRRSRSRRHLAGDAGRGEVDLVGSVGDAVLRQNGA